MKRKHDVLAVLLTILGIALGAAGLWMVRTMGPEWRWGYVLIGVGCGLFGHFMGEFLARRAVESDPKAAKELEIQQKDERNVAIGNAAKAKAFDVMLTTFSPLLLILALLEIDLLPLLLLVAAYLFVVFDSIYWLNRYQKEM